MKQNGNKYSGARLRNRHPSVFSDLDTYLKAYLALLKKVNHGTPGK